MNATLAQNIALIVGALFLLFAIGMGIMLFISNKRDKKVTASLPTLASNEPQATTAAPVFDQQPVDFAFQRPQTGRRESPSPGLPAPISTGQPLTRRALRSQPAGLSPTGPVAQPAASRSFFDDDDTDFDTEWNQGAGSQ